MRAQGAPAPARRSAFVLLPVIGFMAMAALFAFSLQNDDPSRLPSVLIGKPAPDGVLAPVEGLLSGSEPVPGLQPGDLAKGRPSVVNFWASWCAPCVAEHPALMRLAQDQRINLVGINHKDTPDNARRFLAQRGNPFTAVGSDRNGRAAIEWGVYAVPETFVVDGAGRIVLKHIGGITPDALATKILPAIAAAGSTPAR